MPTGDILRSAINLLLLVVSLLAPLSAQTYGFAASLAESNNSQRVTSHTANQMHLVGCVSSLKMHSCAAIFRQALPLATLAGISTLADPRLAPSDFAGSDLAFFSNENLSFAFMIMNMRVPSRYIS